MSTKNATSFGITRNIQQVGGSLSVTSDRETIGYNVEIIRSSLETGLKYLQDSVTCQLFKPWELQDNLKRLKGDISRIPDAVRAVELLHKAAFRTGLGNSIYCPDFQTGNLSSETLQHYFASNFTTNRAAVVGVGIDHQLLVGYAQSLALDSGAGKDNKSTYHGGEIRFDKSGSLAHVAVAAEGASLANPKEALAFAVLQFAAGVGPSAKYGAGQGPLNRGIADAVGDSKVVASSAFNASYTDSGLFGFVVSAKGSDIGKAVLAGLQVLKTCTLSPEDVARGKAQLKAAILYDGENGGRIAEDLGNQAVLTGAARSASAIAAEIDAITSSDVSAVSIFNG